MTHWTEFGLRHVCCYCILTVALMRSKGEQWASLVGSHQLTVPPAVFLPQNLDLQLLNYPSNKIIPADQAWHFLCCGRHGRS